MFLVLNDTMDELEIVQFFGSPSIPIKGKKEKKKVKCKIHPLSFTIFHFSPLSLGFVINPLTFIHFQLSHPLVIS